MSMNFFERQKQAFKSFLDNESGMTLPMLALMLLTMSGFIGTSVDVARLQLVQSRLSFALDAAGLAAGSTLNTSNISTELTKYMNANFPAGYMGSSTPQITSQLSSDNMVIDLTATTVMPTTFMNVFGKDSMTVTANAQITRTSSGLELVMVLDNTGSMAGSRLTALKNAANSLVNILYGTKTTVPDLWIGLVPFSHAVNIGTARTSWLDQAHFATLNWGTSSWAGCVQAREAGGRDIIDDTPSIQSYRAYYVTNNSNRNIYCPGQVTPMTGNKSVITSGINAMQAAGNTHVNTGAIWGWNMISPRWRGLWGGDMNANELPLDYGTKHMNKAVIIMTDGENTMSSSIYTAYGMLSEGRLGSTTSSTVAVNNLNSKLTSVCTAMKQKGIYVYTIAFGSPGTTIQNLLRGCATAPNYYFNSPTNASLLTAFNSIADSLSNLRVSQ